MTPPGRILLVRLSSVGDVVLATPVARRLKRLYPQAELTWLVDAGYEALVASNPDVDRVVGFDYLERHRGPLGIRRLAAELGPVDLMVDLQHKIRTGLLSRWLRPGRRLVLVKRRGADVVRAMVGRDTILAAPHQIWRYLDLLARAGLGEPIDPEAAPPAPVLVADPARLDRNRALLDQRLGDRPPVGLIPSARHATKVWPLEHLTQLARRCLAEGLGVVLLGGRADVAGIGRLAASLGGAGVVDASGGDLGDLTASLAACRAVVSPDSGPAHMAAALGVATVVLFGPTSPERWAPVGGRVEVVRLELACSPCSNHGGASCPVGTFECLRDLSPDQVFSALAGRLAAGAAGG